MKRSSNRRFSRSSLRRRYSKKSKRSKGRKGRKRSTRYKRGGRSMHHRKHRGGMLSASQVVGSQAFQAFKSGVGMLHNYLNKQEAKYGSQSSPMTTTLASRLPPSPASSSASSPSLKRIPTYKTPRYAKGYVSPYKQRGK